LQQIELMEDRSHSQQYPTIHIDDSSHSSEGLTLSESPKASEDAVLARQLQQAEKKLMENEDERLAIRTQYKDDLLEQAAQEEKENALNRQLDEARLLKCGLHYLIKLERFEVAEELLKRNPGLVFDLDNFCNTTLHTAVMHCASEKRRKLFMAVLRANPNALVANNNQEETPFSLALRQGQTAVVEWLQDTTPLDTCMIAFQNNMHRFEQQFRPLLVAMFESLFEDNEMWGADLSEIVFTYLGFQHRKNEKPLPTATQKPLPSNEWGSDEVWDDTLTMNV